MLKKSSVKSGLWKYHEFSPTTGRDNTYFKWCLKVRGYHLTLCFNVDNKDLLGTNERKTETTTTKPLPLKYPLRKWCEKCWWWHFLIMKQSSRLPGFWIFPACWAWPRAIISKSFMPPIPLLWVLMMTGPRQWERPSSVLGRKNAKSYRRK